MIQRKKTSLKTPWDPDTFKVTEVNGSQVKAERRGQKRIRAKNLVKVVRERPPHLQVKEKEYTVWEEQDLEMDMDKIRREPQLELQVQTGEAEQLEQIQDQAEERGDSRLTVETTNTTIQSSRRPCPRIHLLQRRIPPGQRLGLPWPRT